MITIILSDLHLTNKFDKRKFIYLKKIISPADRVILNGDFWDGFLVSFDKFIKSPWNSLFPLLKSKKTVYLYGNHDGKKFSDERVNFFSDSQSYRFNIKIGRRKLRIEHGHKIAPGLEDMFPRISKNKFMNVVFILGGEKFFRFGFFLLGKRFIKIAKVRNTKMKKWSEEILRDHEILVCGHTHLAEFGRDPKYINIGLNHYGYGQYLRIKDEELDLVEEKYYKGRFHTYVRPLLRKFKVAVRKRFSKRQATFTGPIPPGTGV